MIVIKTIIIVFFYDVNALKNNYNCFLLHSCDKKTIKVLGKGNKERIVVFGNKTKDGKAVLVDDLLKLAINLDLKFQSDSDQNNLNIYLDNVEISAELRTEKTAELASNYAMIGPLRESLLIRQQKFKQLPGLVADGRDMGTVVFSDAPFKVFLTADI